MLEASTTIDGNEFHGNEFYISKTRFTKKYLFAFTAD